MFLAPMLEPNDIAFRLLCKKLGAGLTFTGMTSPLSKKKQILEDKPVLQLFPNSPVGIKKFVKKFDKQVSGWDFNLGCPSKLSKRLKHGAFLTDLEKISSILKEIRSSTKKPVFIKIRKSSKAEDLINIAEKENFDAITIHPRTIQQGYSGKADVNFAKKLKQNTKLPVIYSGDVNKKNILLLLKIFDFVMVGRSAIGNPGIFSKKPNKNYFKDYLKLAEKYSLPFRQIKYQAMNFTKSEKNAKEMRRKLVKAKTLQQIKEIYKITS